MGIFGKDFDSKSRSRVSGGGKRVTTRYKDGSREDRTYNKHGRLVDITDHDRNGRSHSHHVGRGLLGPFKGGRK